jgi:hypothetical protein
MRWLTIVLLAAAAACAPVSVDDAGPQSEDDDGGPEAPALQCGTGWERFEPLQGGEDVQLEMGFQGGYHVWGGLRSDELSAGLAELAFEVIVDGETVAASELTTDLRASEGGGGVEVFGVMVFVDQAVDLDALDGAAATLRASATDVTGASLDGAVPVTLRCCPDGFGGPNVGGVDAGAPRGDGGPVDGALDGGVLGGGGSGGAPVLHSIWHSPALAYAGLPHSVWAQASDPEEDRLTYRWTAEHGTFDDDSAPIAGWYPTEVGTWQVSVEVSDGLSTTHGSIEIEVVPQ